MVNPATLEQIFGVSSLAALPVQASLVVVSLLEAFWFVPTFCA